MLIYCIIVNYNSSDDTNRLYTALEALSKLNLKILIIDNASKKSEKDKLTKLIAADELIFNNKNDGYAAGNNSGIKKAIANGADYVWLLNPDIEINNDTLEILLETILTDSKIAAVGPRICDKKDHNLIYSDGGLVNIRDACKATHLNWKKRIERNEQKIVSDVDYVNGSCVLISKNALIENGLLNEYFFLYYEETEWCLRVKQRGWHVVVNPYAVAYHSESLKGMRYFYFMYRNRIWLLKILNKQEYTINLIRELYKELRINLRNKTWPAKYYLLRLFAVIIGILSSPGRYPKIENIDT